MTGVSFRAKLISFGLVVVSSAMLLASCGGNSAPTDMVDLSTNKPADAVTIGEQQSNAANGETDEAVGKLMSHSEDYDKYRSINNETIGWLSVPNTLIEYPVVRAADNDYYLYRSIDGKESASGTVFMDFRNTDPINDRHVIIWGHNMRNGTMFHDLTQYKYADFFHNNRDITLVIGDKEYRYEIYTAYIVNTSTDFIDTKFQTDSEFVTYMNDLRGLSKLTPNPDITLTKDDHILTLVTCTYEYDDSRYVVQARRVA